VGFGGVHPLRDLFVREFLAESQCDGSRVVETDVFLLLGGGIEGGKGGYVLLRDGMFVLWCGGTHWSVCNVPSSVSKMDGSVSNRNKRGDGDGGLSRM